MILWPGNLFPSSLVGGGLRIWNTFVAIIVRRFSGKHDPKRILVRVSAEQTLVDVANEPILVDCVVESAVNAKIPAMESTIDIGTERTMVILK